MQPIAAHPLFPTTVALWLGAIFTLLGLAIRPVLMERAVLALGIDRVLPMAAPPLGTTARVLILLALAALGCTIGFFVARRLAPGVHEALHQTATDLPEPSLLTQRGPAEQIDTESAEDEQAEHDARRRRQLAILPDDGPVEAPAQPAAPQILKVADLGLASFDQAFEPEPFVRSTAWTDETLSVEPGFSSLPPEAEEDELPLDLALEVKTDSAPQDAPASGAAGAAEEERRATAAERIAASPLDELSHVELLERLALALERRRADPQGAPDAGPEDREAAARAAAKVAEGYAALLARSATDRPSADGLPAGGKPATASVVALRSIGSAGFGGTAARPRRPFDGPTAPAEAQDTDAALRDALKTLQRLSGAA